MAKIKDLKQDDMSGANQVIFFNEFNKITGQWIPKFETRYYSEYDNLYAVQEFFLLTGDNADTKKYKAIKRLSKCLYSGPDFKKAMSARV